MIMYIVPQTGLMGTVSI